MPFFIRGRRPPPKTKKKTTNKRGGKDKGEPANKKPKISNKEDEEITSDEEEYAKGMGSGEEDTKEENEEDLETAQEKKVRLARQYIDELKQEKLEEEEDKNIVNDTIAHRLRDDVLEAAGRLYKTVASSIAEADLESRLVLKCKLQKLPITCATITQDDQFIFAGSKDCAIVKYSLEGKRLGVIPGGRKGTEEVHIGHTSHVYSIAVSSDGKFLASGDQKGNIHIWDAEKLEHLKHLKKHRRAISGLVFQRGSHILYSASHDRLVMVWNIDAMAFVEHLGGHQDAITGIDALYRESCITCGGRDQSVIVYVITEDKQLQFSGHRDSIDGIKLINEKNFITFGQDGAICLWSTQKKRPQHVISAAHGYQSNGLPYWITAVAAVVNADLVASGSLDGFVRLWKVDKNPLKMEQLFTIPINGVVNSLDFTTNGSHLIVGLGQEHRWGRWYKVKGAKNAVVVIPLVKSVVKSALDVQRD